MATEKPNNQSGQEATKRRGFWDFWTTLPGILTGLAAFIGAVVGVVNLIGPDSSPAGQGAMFSVTTAATTSTVLGGGTSSSVETSTTLATTVGELLYDRSIDIALDYGVELDSYRIVPKLDSDVYYIGSFFSAAMEANEELNVVLAGLDRGQSGYQACKDATGYVPSVDIKSVRPGYTFCTFSVDKQKVAQFRFVKVKSTGSNPVLTWKITIWSDS